jgi:uncharacterized protein (TIGR02145 family)
MRNLKYFILSFISILMLQCEKDIFPGKINIVSLENLTHNSLIVVSEMTDIRDGNSNVNNGVCIDKSRIPEVNASSFRGISQSTGEHGSTGISGLEPDTRYILRAWLETNDGFVYSDTVHIRTKSVEMLTDPRDSQRYPVKQFGNQWWMVQNLNYLSPESVAFQNEKNNPPEFGRLYPYNEAFSVCPSGWHLPADEDWKALETFIGVSSADLDKSVQRGSPFGGMMKEPGMRFWDTESVTHSTNQTGFSVVPAGWYNISQKEFTSATFYAGFWSKSENAVNSYCRVFYSTSDGISRFYHAIDMYKYSVRCVK